MTKEHSEEHNKHMVKTKFCRDVKTTNTWLTQNFRQISIDGYKNY